MTMNDTWGYKSYDDNWKSPTDLIRKLVDITSKGGNFLLNVGPTAEGLIPQPSVDRLAAVGRWMNLNNESIYGTTASVFRRLDWGRCTVKPGKLYLHVFDWPKDYRLAIPGLQNQVTAAYLLTDLRRDPLPVSRDNGTVYVSVPGKVYDPIDTVVVLEIKGEPKVAPQPVKLQADGTALLKAIEADVQGHVNIHGYALRYEEGQDKDCLGNWTNKDDSASWFFEAPAPGKYVVEITYSCAKGQAGSDFQAEFEGQKLTAKTRDTGDWTKFRTGRLGTVTVKATGPATITVAPVTIAKDALMNLRALSLKPAPEKKKGK